MCVCVSPMEQGKYHSIQLYIFFFIGTYLNLNTQGVAIVQFQVVLSL